MSSNPTPPSPPVSVKEWMALNGEIAQLVEHGLPLEPGLGAIAADFGGGVGRLAGQLKASLDEGKTLADALAAMGDSLPPLYRAAALAGVRAGRLGASLQSMATTAERQTELRDIVLRASIYPALVFLLAWGIALWAAWVLVPHFDRLGHPPHAWLGVLRSPTALATLGAAVPMLLCVGVWRWLKRSKSATVVDEAAEGRLTSRRRVAVLSGQAQFAELLGMLIDCRTPLHEAISLAGDASGITELASTCRQIATTLQTGAPAPARDAVPNRLVYRSLPALVRLALTGPQNPTEVARRLRVAASTYHDRAVRRLHIASVTIPMFATLGVGGMVAALYAFFFAQPYFVLLRELQSW